MSKTLLYQFLKAGAHFGCKTNLWNPKMFPYIYSEYKGIYIIDLMQTIQRVRRASNFLKSVASQKDKTFLFICTKKQIRRLLAYEAKRCNSFYVNNRWLGGMLTNWSTVKNRIDRLKMLEQQEDKGVFKLLPKKEASIRLKELEKLKKLLSGIKNMKKLPDIAIIIDQKQDITAIQECRKLRIPIISIIDTNCDPDIIDIPIPGNNDAACAVKLILRLLSDSILIGRRKSLNLS